MNRKPDTCSSCRLYHIPTVGFCADSAPKGAKVGVLLYRPGRESAVTGDPWDADSMYSVLRTYNKLGFTKDDILVAYLIRCYFAHSSKGTLPKTNAQHALTLCRQYDQALRAWRPNAVVYTYDLEGAFGSPPMQCINELAASKARQLADRGYRPLVAYGKEVLEFLDPQLKGGLGSWKLHIDTKFHWRP